MHIAGDSLYVVTDIVNVYETTNLYIFDISQDNFVQTAIYELKTGALDNSMFSDNRYVYFFSYCVESYYIDRSTGVLHEIEFPVTYVSNYLEPYLFDSVFNEEEEIWYVRVRDITDIENPEQVFLGILGTLWAGYNVTSVNDSTIIITTASNEGEKILKFIDISDIYNLQEISQIETGHFLDLEAPVLISDEYLFIYSHYEGNRWIYNISDINNPVLECEWYLETVNKACKTIAYEDYFYVKRGQQGIAKYSLSQLPITEPENYFGKLFQVDIVCSFDGNRVIIYERDKIIKKDFPDDEGTVIYQDEELDYYNGGFACNDSLVIVKIIGSGLMDLKIIETETGEIKSSYENWQYCQQIKYIEPYFYMFSYIGSNFIVYEIDSDWNLVEIANIAPSGAAKLDIRDFVDDKVWVSTESLVFFYDTNNFDNYVYYPSSLFAVNGELSYLEFVNDDNIFCVQYFGCQSARFFQYIPDQEPELIEDKYFGEYNVLRLVEDTVISSRISFSSYLYHISSAGLSEPYSEFEFGNNVGWYHFDEENNRIFVRKFGSYESFTYDYFVGTSDEEIPNTNEILTTSNYPNPFNPTTTISFNLATESDVSVEVYNVKGQKVNTLLNEEMPKGQHEVIWNGFDDNNKPVSSGVYFYKVNTGKQESAKRMILLK
jgi:FlgD Ig-like domain